MKIRARMLCTGIFALNLYMHVFIVIRLLYLMNCEIFAKNGFDPSDLRTERVD